MTIIIINNNIYIIYIVYIVSRGLFPYFYLWLIYGLFMAINGEPPPLSTKKALRMNNLP